MLDIARELVQLAGARVRTSEVSSGDDYCPGLRVDRALRYSPTLTYPHATRGDGAPPQQKAPKQGKDKCLMKRNFQKEVQKIQQSTSRAAANQCTYGKSLPPGRLAWRVSGSLRR